MGDEVEIDLDALVSKFRAHVPDDKSDDEIRALVQECNGDEEEIQRRVAEWWETSGGDEAEAEGGENEQAQPQEEASSPQEEDAPPPVPEKTADPEPPAPASPKGDAPKEDAKERRRSAKGSSRSKSGSSDKEMMDFRHLMVKGLELKRFRGGSSEKCVIYMDVTCRTFFVAKQKNAANAKAYRVEDIAEASASSSNEKIIAIMHKEGQVDLEVSSPKVRDYLVRMLNKLFTLEKTRTNEDKEERASGKSGRKSSTGGGSSRSKGSSRSSRRDRDDEDGGGRGGRRTQVSQVRLLAEHCYSLGDDKVEELVSAKIPTHSRWESYQEFKDKINRRDELIRSLQDALGTINSERVRFQRACEDIELHHQEELHELKQHLAMALQSFQELQRASEHRESEMREALKGAVERSSKFEAEKSQLLESMNDQRMNNAASEKEVEMLKEAIKKQTGDLEKKSAECEDARKRFTQVKEALTVERNLRARAEIKEEQMRQETIALTGQMHAMRDKLTTELHTNTKEVEDKTAELQEAIDGLEAAKKELEEKLEQKNHEIKVVRGEMEGLKEALDETENKAESLAQLAEKAGLVEGLQHQVQQLEAEKANLEQNHGSKIEELKQVIEEQEKKLAEADDNRRKMHNIIQELRGNIRVYIRVRPFLPNDGVDLEGKLDPTITVKNDGCTAEIVRKDEDGAVAETHKWSFDKAFAMASTQDDIFNEVSEFVQSALDGYNVCLFSYGQTGSGKTHTMQGYGRGEMAGIIPRAIEQIGKYRDTVAEKGWVYTMQVTFIEIYNEVTYDLLREEGSEKDALDIKQDQRGRTYVAGANKLEIDPHDNKAIDDLIDTAALHRQTASTNMNAQSSRSHSIFTLYLEGTNSEMGAKVRGTLHLCDLAGSERIARSGAEGDRLKEAVNINKSLSCLTDVFNALGNKQAFIPFRNSKLTYFLQPALSGDGKTMMFVNLSPTSESYFESLCSLRFAANVNKVELGKAQRNVVELPQEGGGGGSAKSPSSKSPAAKKTGGKTTGRADNKSPARSPASRRAGAKK